MKTLLTLLLLFSFAAGPVAHASQAGEIDLADLSDSYGDPKVEINLHQALLQMVGAFANKEDPEVAKMLSTIELIKVRVYDLKGDAQKAIDAVDQVSQKIRDSAWQPVVSVNEEQSKVRIFSRMTNEKMDGLVVMVVNQQGPGEAVFINIVGEIDPAQVSRVTRSLNINTGPVK